MQKKLSLNWIFNNLKKPSVGLFLLLLGTNAIYFLPLLFPKSLYEGAQLGTYRYYLLSWLLICVGGFLESAESDFWFLRRKPFWTLFLLSAIGWTTLFSALNGEDLIPLISKIFPFFWLLLVPMVGFREQNWPWLWITFLFHGVIGIIYTIYANFSMGAISRYAIMFMEGQNFYSICLYMTALFFMILPMARSRTFTIICYGFFIFGLLQALFYSFRLPWFLIPIQLILVFYIFVRTGGVKSLLRGSINLIFVAFLIILISLTFENSSIVSQLGPTFKQAYTGLAQRMSEKGDILDTILQNERWIELNAVVADMNGIGDWIFGKSMAARWSNPNFARGEFRWMVHNTWLNSFYWGGMLLAFTVSWPMVWGIRLLFRSKNVEALCFAAFVLVSFVSFPFYLKTTTTPEWLLFCLVLGPCIRYESELPHRKSFIEHKREQIDKVSEVRHSK